MLLDRAQFLADELMEVVRPYVVRIEIAGSIRRLKPVDVHDIDLVAEVAPLAQPSLRYAVQEAGCSFIRGGGSKAWRLSFRGCGVDFYMPAPEEFFPTLLHRTGSQQHNEALALRALSMGLRFTAAGIVDGRTGERMAWASEPEIFKALRLEYVRPEDRSP